MATVPPSAATTNLFAKLRSLLQGYGLRDFAVYTFDGGELTLAFSSGEAASAATSAHDALVVERLPSLASFIGSGRIAAFRPPPGAGTLPGLFVELSTASAVFKMAAGGTPLGLIVAFGEVPSQASDGEGLDELERLIEFFSGQLAKHEADASLIREHERARSKLQELQEGLSLLQVTDRVALFTALMQRVLSVLGSDAGMLWLRRAGDWRCEQLVGEAPADPDLVRGLIERCFESGKPGLISSLSDEETWDLDGDSIQLASLAVFPLRTATKVTGAIVAIEATVSRDAVEVIEGTSLVGGTAIETWQNAQQAFEQHRLEDQLALAARAQQRLLPAGRVEVPGLSMAHFSRYCDETGGDYLDVIPGAEPVRCAFVVGDVAGHGIGAAMLMVDLRARLRTHLESRDLWSPEQVMRALNRALCREVRPAEFVTLFLCVFDTRTGALRYASAGHEPPLLFRPWENRWEELPSTGLPLGIDAAARYDVESLRVEPEDVLVFATDGATEAHNADGVPFGIAGIKRAVEEHAEEEADVLVARIVEETLKHHGDRAFADDVTYLVVKVEQITLRLASAAPEMEGEPTWVERFVCTPAAKDARLPVVEKVLEELYGDYDLSEFLFALDEALTNAIQHGNRGQPDAEVEVKLWCDGPLVTLFIEHQGEPFDPRLEVPELIDEDTLRRESGRGLLIMISLMDEAIYWNEGRSLALVKRLKQEG